MRTLIFKNEINEIIQKASEFFDIPVSEILSRQRTADLSMARFFIFKYLMEELGLKSQRIGSIFGKNHSTIIYGVKKLEDYFTIYKGLKEEWERFKLFVNGGKFIDLSKFKKVFDCSFAFDQDGIFKFTLYKNNSIFFVELTLEMDGMRKRFASDINDLEDPLLVNFISSLNGKSDIIKGILHEINKAKGLWQEQTSQK